MENKIDIAAILKDCPRNMELDCTIYDGVTLDSVVFESEYHYENTNTYPIKIVTKSGFSTKLTKYGQNVDIEEAKCVIFPKGKKSWEGFQRPFVDGDIIADDHGNIAIYKGLMWYNKKLANYYCGYRKSDNKFLIKIEKDGQYGHFGLIEELHYASKEEKQKLFDVIKDNNYKWDKKIKTLEKVKPKFKVGDRIRHKNDKTIIKTIDFVYYDSYALCGGNLLYFKEQDQYELVPNKFDFSTLKTFDEVLVRLTNNCVWMPKLFSHYDTDPKVKCYPFVTIENIGYPQCIPYNGNEHLSRTTNNCDEFYRNWEE